MSEGESSPEKAPEVAGEKEFWFNESSFLEEDSFMKYCEEEEEEEGEEEEIGSGDHVHLRDLSCSLLNCGDLHESISNASGILGEAGLDSIVSKLKKKDELTASLVGHLRAVLGRTAEGDKILSAVEKHLELIAEGLGRSSFVRDQAKRRCGVAASTQTALEEYHEDGGIIDTDDIHSNKREVGTSPFHVVKKRRNVESVEEHAAEEEDEDEHMYSSPHRLSFVPPNPDSLRLTFSPTICEYEAESHHNQDSHSQLAVIEDLRLQIADYTRKLSAKQKFLDEMTVEREQEREEFQKALIELTIKYDDAKREKEKAQAAMEHFQMEVKELDEQLRVREDSEASLLEKLQGKEYELEMAVDKIFELRHIVRTLESQQDASAKETEKLMANLEMVPRLLQDDSCHLEQDTLVEKDALNASDLEFTEEIHSLVEELARKIEDKVVELESFSWQNRPNSSCSMKSGDDVSVRTPSTRLNSANDSLAPQDFISKVFCALKRLESNFDGLVRFEEVLLKKMKDAELRITMDKSKLNEFKSENLKLKGDLLKCHHKIKEFEIYLKSGRTADSLLHNSVEHIRNVDWNQSHQAWGGASPISHFVEEKEEEAPDPVNGAINAIGGMLGFGGSRAQTTGGNGAGPDGSQASNRGGGGTSAAAGGQALTSGGNPALSSGGSSATGPGASVGGSGGGTALNSSGSYTTGPGASVGGSGGVQSLSSDSSMAGPGGGQAMSRVASSAGPGSGDSQAFFGPSASQVVGPGGSQASMAGPGGSQASMAGPGGAQDLSRAASMAPSGGQDLSRAASVAGPGGGQGLSRAASTAGPGGAPALSREASMTGPGGVPALSREASMAGPGGVQDLSRAASMAGPGGVQALSREASMAGPGGVQALSREASMAGPGGVQALSREASMAGPGGVQALSREASMAGPGGVQALSREASMAGPGGVQALSREASMAGPGGVQALSRESSMAPGQIVSRAASMAGPGGVQDLSRAASMAPSGGQDLSRAASMAGPGGVQALSREASIAGPGGVQALSREASMAGPGGVQDLSRAASMAGPGGVQDLSRASSMAPSGGQDLSRAASMAGPGGVQALSREASIAGPGGGQDFSRATSMAGPVGVQALSREASLAGPVDSQAFVPESNDVSHGNLPNGVSSTRTSMPSVHGSGADFPGPAGELSNQAITETDSSKFDLGDRIEGHDVQPGHPGAGGHSPSELDLLQEEHAARVSQILHRQPSMSVSGRLRGSIRASKLAQKKSKSTGSDFDDSMRFVGERIIPPEDLKALSPNIESQRTRLSETNAVIELAQVKNELQTAKDEYRKLLDEFERLRKKFEECSKASETDSINMAFLQRKYDCAVSTLTALVKTQQESIQQLKAENACLRSQLPQQGYPYQNANRM